MTQRSNLRRVTVTAVVKPGAKSNEITETAPGTFLVKTRARAANNQANKSVITLLGEYFGIAPSRFAIIRGHRSRTKIIAIT